VVGGNVLWGWNGVNRGAVTENITVSDVQWLMRYLGRISDDQLRDALSASGMTSIETNCYARALRARINALRQVAASPSPALAGD
jgi:hypothetical protein